MVNQDDEADLSEPKNWTVEDEVHLLYSTLDNKPVGVDKHFQMSIIWNKFTSNSNKNVTSDVLWKKLNSWYNLKSLDNSETLPISLEEEEFLLPSEVVPEYVFKTLTDDDKKFIDFSGLYKKFISPSESDDDETDKPQFKLKGNDKMKWFEFPQNFKSNDRSSKKSYDSKSKSDLNDSLSEGIDTKKIIRQYGKAGEVTSGSFLTLNISSSIFDESDENIMEGDAPKEEVTDFKRNTSSTDAKNDLDKSSKAKRKRSMKPETTAAVDSETSEHSTPVKNPVRSSKTAEPITRGRKASSTSQDVSSGTESEKNIPISSNDENAKNPKRRFSQRVSSSDTKTETPIKTNEGSSKSDAKRKIASRR